MLALVALASLAQGRAATTPVKGASPASGYDTLAWEARRLVDRRMRRDRLAGLSIALVDDRTLVWTEGFGFADQARRIPATPDTLYRVGSISKLFTAMAVMQLAELGRLRLEDPVIRHLPDFTLATSHGPLEDIQVRHLLTHHAGLPGSHLKGMWSSEPGPASSLLTGLREEASVYPPGWVFHYSNVGPALAGLIVERLRGESFADAMKQTILTPLGMGRSAFSQRVAPDPLMARGYRKGRVADDPPLRDPAAGGLVSSAREMSRFIRMLFADGRADNGRSVVSPRALAEMLRAQNADRALDLDLRVGLGWMLSGIDIPGAGAVIHHAGATLSYSAQLIALPEHKLGVVVLTNSAEGGEAAMGLATEILTLALRTKMPSPAVEPESAAPVQTGDLADPRAVYLGDWTTEVGLVRIRERRGQLVADALGRTFSLERRDDGQLGVHYRWLGLVPLDLGDVGKVGIASRRLEGRGVLSMRQGRDDLLLGTRLPKVAVPAAWRERLGDYRLLDPGADAELLDGIRLRLSDDRLVLEVRADGESLSLALQPLDDREALLAGKVAGFGERVRVQRRAGAEFLRYSGYSFGRIRTGKR